MELAERRAAAGHIPAASSRNLTASSSSSSSSSVQNRIGTSVDLNIFRPIEMTVMPAKPTVPQV
jgi:hypothetical protein